MIELKYGDDIRVGDMIISNWNSKLIVHRITKCYAFVKYNEIAEGKFPIIYGNNFHPIPRSKGYSTVSYRVFRE